MTAYLLHVPKAICLTNPRTHYQSIMDMWKQERLHPVDLNEFPDTFKFIFVRHPLIRLVDAYSTYVSGMECCNEIGEVKQSFKPTNPALSFDLFCEQIVRHTDDAQLWPQTHHSFHLEEADFVGRCENFDADATALKAHLKISGTVYKTFRARQERDPMKAIAALDPDVHDKINTYYELDFDRLKYLPF